MRDICEGKSGLPAKTEAAYRERWANGRPVRLGDVVEKIIRILTLGLLKPFSGCGCAKRKRKLNECVLWYHHP